MKAAWGLGYTEKVLITSLPMRNGRIGETWENMGKNLSNNAEEIGQIMRESCEKIETIHELEVIDDLLKEKINT